jgi:hypothetical protein
VLKITLPGDVNGDYKVTLPDLVLLAQAYGTHCANYHYVGEAASAKWNPNADFNNDGIVNLSDLVTLALHYNKSVTPTHFTTG